MVRAETALYPIDTPQVFYFFCIHRYKKRTSLRFCDFVLITIQLIRKKRGRYFRRYAKKKEIDILRKKAKTLGVLAGLAQWTKRFTGVFFRVNKNFVLIFKGAGRYKEIMKKGVSGLKTVVKKLRGSVPTLLLEKNIQKKYPFLKGFHLRVY